MKTNLVDVTGASAFVDLSTQEIPCEIDEQPDPLAKFAEDAALAGTYRRDGWRYVEAFQSEMQETEARIATLHKLTAPRDDFDEPLTDGGPLEKAFSASARRRDSLKIWMRGEIAKGETVGSLVAYARQTDADTARLIASIGEEL